MLRTYLSESSFEYWMSSVTLEVVGALIEVAHSWDVVLPVLPQHCSIVAHYHRGVPYGAAVHRITLQDGRDDDHVVLRGHLETRIRRIHS